MYNTKTGATYFAIGGAILGGVAGVGLSAYVGWELGDYFKNLLELGPTAGFGLKLITAVGTTSIAGTFTGAIGVVGGAVSCGLVGAVTGLAKESLDSLVAKLSSKNKKE